MTERVSFTTLFFKFLALLLMALLTFIPETTSSESKTKPKNSENKKQLSKHKKNKQQKQPSSWDQIKNLLTCKQVEGTVHNPSKTNPQTYSKLGSSCSSICTFRDVVHGNTSRVVHRADNSPESSSLGQETRLLNNKKSVHGSSSSRSLAASSIKSSGGGSTYSSATAAARAMKVSGGSTYSTTSSRGMQFRKLSGCYECHTIVDPSRYPLPRTTICACSECGEVFPKIESLEHHQAVKHAVSELGPEDSSRNIVEIIFKSSWLKKDNPICKIERILKVHNTPKTIQRFEDCREAVKIRAKKNARCAADGNELLRFHCTTLTCSLGSRGSTSLCGSASSCGVCTIIRHGFQGGKGSGVHTTASSGRAHDCLGGIQGRRAMLVCRVIAGKVKRVEENAPVGVAGMMTMGEELSGGSYDSVAGYGGVYSNLEELHVYSPRAILPCFVVIYKAVEY
ncbi:C2H2 zinc finger transcription factor [Lithospermum erythrorhizon]|uniref:C2H2 zinc finger transcription factor n=1 Tax=Lithospermum erythrorhizon TaxID=34254 RepID=A0AAV3QVV6_LITER